MTKTKIRKNQKFGDWKYIEDGEPRRYKYKTLRMLICRCKCGNVREVFYSNVIRGKSTNCGCKLKKYE